MNTSETFRLLRIGLAMTSAIVVSGCNKDEMKSPDNSQIQNETPAGRPPPTYLINWTGSTPQVFDVWQFAQDCSPVGTLYYGVSPIGILKISQTSTTLTVEGEVTHCGAPVSPYFTFAKGGSPTACGIEYWIVPRTGPASRKVLTLRVKGVVTIPFSSGLPGGYFTYNPTLGTWAVSSAAVSSFCYSTSISISSVPGACC